MMDKSKIIIRSFEKDDRGPLRKLCADTAFMGEPVEKFCPDRELFADWACSYYTDYEPESIFVAEYEGRVRGYIMGSKDELKYRRVSAELSRLLLKRTLGRFLFEPSSRRLLFNLAKSFVSGEFKRPDFSRHYPAHLHINLDKAFRGNGIGPMLIFRFESYLLGVKVYGVRLATISARANRFFQKQGFGILYRRRVTYFDYLAREEIYLSMYGKTLERG